MEEWNIQRRADRCAITNLPFQDGDIIYSMLFLSKNGYERKDLSAQAWRERNINIQPVSYWQSKYHPPPPPPPEPLKKDDAESLLRQLLKDNDPDKVSVQYILAVMLERKRIFKQSDYFRHDELGKVIVYEHLKTGESFTIIDPELRLDQLEPVQKEVAELLAGRDKTKDGATGTPPPSATPPN